MKGYIHAQVVIMVELNGKVIPITNDDKTMAVFKDQLAAERFIKDDPLCKMGTLHMHEVINAKVTEP